MGRTLPHRRVDPLEHHPREPRRASLAPADAREFRLPILMRRHRCVPLLAHLPARLQRADRRETWAVRRSRHLRAETPAPAAAHARHGATVPWCDQPCVHRMMMSVSSGSQTHPPIPVRVSIGPTGPRRERGSERGAHRISASARVQQGMKEARATSRSAQWLEVAICTEGRPGGSTGKQHPRTHTCG